MSQSFTVSANNGILRVLQTDVEVGPVFDSSTPPPYPFKKFTGIWDTGATGSVITQRVVDECGLKPTGMAVVHGVHGPSTTETFLVNVAVPNKVLFEGVKVTKGLLLGADMLIGMDIITSGDFAITHHGGKTCFSFRFPSSKRIDFVEEHNSPKPVQRDLSRIGRNDKCPCGSGKKYKKCHGASSTPAS